jgi:hypothetical protein
LKKDAAAIIPDAFFVLGLVLFVLARGDAGSEAEKNKEREAGRFVVLKPHTS